MVVQERQVVRGDVEISVGKSNVDGSVDDRVLWSVLEDGTVGLNSISSVLASDLDRSVGDVELVNESEERRLSRVDQTADRCVVTVVVRDSLAGRLPAKLNSVTRLRERSTVVSDGCVVTVLEQVGLVGDRQEREDRELDTGVLSRALDEVSGEQSPRHGLRDTRLEPDWHRVSARELTEDHLLPSLGGDRLEEKLSRVSRVEVGKEAIDTRFTPSGKTLAEVDKVAYSVKVVLVLALEGSGSATVVDDVGEELGVTNLLVGHELDQ